MMAILTLWFQIAVDDTVRVEALYPLDNFHRVEPRPVPTQAAKARELRGQVSARVEILLCLSTGGNAILRKRRTMTR